ncbi:helix-turn-helix domain-containing protein [Dictyobacter arantiisoli]|uniref:Helix-turn-helix domain-containing protein n=1 Tax=Dictyobacter arantiisoli TaxID=2014874 RepID=A0A5A5TG35_9CHLR|nr:helix-turn-helix domain-containing protein [Dictyobacter arantiisoli]GCF10541.1 hypothetical protein KDI_41050 [Dictyobacter arantiisoli]
MKDMFPLPHIPGYVDIKEAAKILGVAESSIYRYVQSGRLSGYQAGHNIVIELESLKQFKPKNTGRPRTNIPLWRIPPDENSLLQTSICAQILQGQQETFKLRMEEFRLKKEHLFPGTVARYISISNKQPNFVKITFIWRISVIPEENIRKQSLDAFKERLADIVDWTTAQFDEYTVFIYA